MAGPASALNALLQKKRLGQFAKWSPFGMIGFSSAHALASAASGFESCWPH